ncbi:hypothetical protein [Fibrobacter sp.]|uniref:hypothetical protein n=1 Tax=Fibrobacter sp. TaxID=35828 RepID=UPI00386DE5CD
MNKILLAALCATFIVACSDDSSSTSATNNEVTSCSYTFECNASTHVKDNKIYIENDSIVLSNLFLNYAHSDSWTMANYMKRLNETYWDSFILKDTLLTDSQVSENEHHAAFASTTDDEIIFTTYGSPEGAEQFVANTYQECKTDDICSMMFQNSITEKEDSLKANDIENFVKLSKYYSKLSGESTCNLAKTECKKERYVTE